jgi:L-alanine-DL-glutamate epimerase-like enolase superfamily enzyme
MRNQIDRRHFLGTLASAAPLAALGPASTLAAWPSGPAPTVEAVEVFPITYPMDGRFKFFEDPQGTLTGRASAIVKITASDGTVGWGESIPIPKWSYETLESVTTTLRQYLTPVLLGRSVFDLAGAHRAMDQVVAPSFSTGQPMAKAGVDLALHDLVGRITGRSLPELWGRSARSEITLSWTLNPETLDDLPGLIQEGRRHGVEHFNVKVGAGREYDLSLCRRVREAAPDGFLWADANGGFAPAEIRSFVPDLTEAGIDVLEQPLPANRLTAYRELRREAEVPILMDEGVVSPSTLMELIRMDVLDGVAMKIPRCGGLYPAKRQIEILRDAGLMVLGSGLTDPGISLAATLILYGSFGYDRPAALNGPQFIAESVLEDPFQPEEGVLPVPEGPGLGIEVDESKIDDLRVSLD